MKGQRDKDIIGEARALYSQMAGEAKRRARLDHQAARRRGPIAKALFVACFIAGVVAAVSLVYGIITFADGPIRETARGYVGKHGAQYTREHYERFNLWERFVWVSFGLAFLTGFCAVAADRIGRRRRGGE